MDLHAACHQIGIRFKDVPADDAWHTTGVVGKQRSDAGRIYLFGDGSGGMVWNWTIDQSLTFWTDDRHDLSPAEKRERSRKAKAAIQKAEADREKRYAEAARLSALVYEDADPASPDHPYLLRKGVIPTSTLRELQVDELAGIIGYHPSAKDVPLSGRILIVPVAQSELTSLEFIDESGRKSALAGSRRRGSYWRTPGEGDVLFLCEGVATALSVHMATGCPAAAVLSCGNFPAVISHVKSLGKSVVVCPDIGNGQDKAVAAAREHDLLTVLPVVAQGTDFNDMHAESGLDAVGDLLATVIPQKRRQFLPLPDMVAALPDRIEWQVHNFIEAGSTICLFGASEQGKSFIVADLAMSIATGQPFAGMAVTQGSVLILVGEGRNGFLRRLQAWCSHHGHDLPDNVYISTYNVDIYKPLELPDCHIDCIFCDTLAQHYDGDENDASSMMAFLARMELIQRRYSGSTVCIVHHSGTQSADRTRGSTALRAALDSEFKVHSNVLSCSKMKDFEHPKPLPFRLESEGQSAIIVWGEDTNFEKRMTPSARVCHQQLIHAVRLVGHNYVSKDMLRPLVYPRLNSNEEGKRTEFTRALENLVKNGGAEQVVSEGGTGGGTIGYKLVRPQDIELASFRWLSETLETGEETEKN